MPDDITRRDWLKTMSVASAGAMVPGVSTPIDHRPSPIGATPVPILDLSSTSEIFVPPRGRSYMKFSFDFPEPSVQFGDYRFGFLVFTDENTYGLDRMKLTASGTNELATLTADGFVWAGGQEKVPGKLVATLRNTGDNIEWHVEAEMDRPIKTITSIIRGVPRGQVSFGGGGFTDPRDGESLVGYPFGGGDLNAAGGMTTPLLMIQPPGADVTYVSSLDDKVRPKKFYLAPGETTYRVEAIYEHDAWKNDKRVATPAWRIGRAPTADAAAELHMRHLERAYGLPAFSSRPDVPDWLRNIAMVTTLHGQHYTGFIFNDYAEQLQILRWMSEQMPANRVLVFLAAWDGRYYWD